MLTALEPTLALPIWILVGVHGANLFFIALLVHGRLASERPPAERLTEFYLLLSIGGVIGGIFAALIAPQLFSTIAEYPLAIVLALLLRPGAFRPPKAGPLRRNADLLLPFAVLIGTLFLAKMTTGPVRLLPLAAVLAVALFARRPLRFALGVGALLLITAWPPPALTSDRTFFGVLRVEQAGAKHVLVNGTTIHGVENFARGHRGEPLSYYSRQGPLGQIFHAYDDRISSVGVIGLGSGAVAAYGRPGDDFTFYEINPAVARIASDPRYFTFVPESKANVRIVIGDGRLEMEKAPDHSYDLIVLDAFSSDSIPVHLLTREAVAALPAQARAGRHPRVPHLQPLLHAGAGRRRHRPLARPHGLYQMHVASPERIAARRRHLAVGRRRATAGDARAARPLGALAAGSGRRRGVDRSVLEHPRHRSLAPLT